MLFIMIFKHTEQVFTMGINLFIITKYNQRVLINISPFIIIIIYNTKMYLFV